MEFPVSGQAPDALQYAASSKRLATGLSGLRHRAPPPNEVRDSSAGMLVGEAVGSGPSAVSMRRRVSWLET